MLNSSPVSRDAWRMLVIAFLIQSTTVACLYGPFTILLTAVEQRTGAGRNVTSMGIMLVSLVSGLLAPVAGYLSQRVSLRLLAIVGLLLSAAGYALLASTSNIRVFLAAYGLLIGTGACLSTIVVPAVLVTRWFNAHRGRALGILHMPIMAVITPLIVVRLLDRYGLPTDYLFLAALCTIIVIPSLFIIDHPPGALGTTDTPRNPTRGTKGAGLVPIISRPVFWALSLATASVIASGITMGTHLVPMVTQWGVPKTQAATLVSLGSLASIAGALLFGWLAEKTGGARTIALICLLCGSMWGLMLLHPGYLALAAIVGVSALCLAGVVPAFTLTLSRIFARESFGPAFGVGTLVFMGLSPSMAPITGAIFVRTRAYTDAIILLIILLAVGTLLALSATAMGRAHPLAEQS